MSDRVNHNPEPSKTAQRIGCVSFLNARPLVDGLESDPAIDLRFAVPSALLAMLLGGQVDVALCPVVDYQLAEQPLSVVPVGGIGSEAATLTVRLFSQVPFEQVDRMVIDSDSHTSIVLARLLLAERYGRLPMLETPAGPDAPAPTTMLLIGDKVVHGAMDDPRYPHQLDLGEAWRQMTNLPFVFAVWMARRGALLGTLPNTLKRCREANASRIGAIARRYAADAGFGVDLAEKYLGQLLSYQIGIRELAAMRKFWTLAHGRGLLPRNRELVIDPTPDTAAV